MIRLIDLGADDKARDQDNHTALDHAWFWLEADLAYDMDGTLDVLKRAGGLSDDSAMPSREELMDMLDEDEDDEDDQGAGVDTGGFAAGQHRSFVKDAQGKVEAGGGGGDVGGGAMMREGSLWDAIVDGDEGEEEPRGVRFEREEMEEVDLEDLPVEDGDIPHWNTAAWEEKLRQFTASGGNETVGHGGWGMRAGGKGVVLARGRGGKGETERSYSNSTSTRNKNSLVRNELMIGGEEDSQDEDSADKKPVLPRFASAFDEHDRDYLGDIADVIEVGMYSAIAIRDLGRERDLLCQGFQRFVWPSAKLTCPCGIPLPPHMASQARNAEVERMKNERDLYESMLPPEFRGGDLVKQIYRN